MFSFYELGRREYHSKDKRSYIDYDGQWFIVFKGERKPGRYTTRALARQTIRLMKKVEYETSLQRTAEDSRGNS